MEPVPDSFPSLSTIVSYLFTQRKAILTNWRTSCDADAELNKGKTSSLSREEVTNLLLILEQRLLGKASDVGSILTTQVHDLHRWQTSLMLIDTMRELAQLSQILYHELKLFQELFPETDAHLLQHVRHQITQLVHETIVGGVLNYEELQRLKATQRARQLQQAIDQLTEVSSERVNLLRTTSHDLRSALGIINMAAYMLEPEGLSQAQREQYVDMLSRNLIAIQAMLAGLMDLSRLEAGEELLDI